MVTARVGRYLAAAIFHLLVAIAVIGLFRLGLVLNQSIYVEASIILLVFHVLFWRRNPVGYRMLQEILIPTFKCARCRTIWPLEQYWRCTCGATTEHHVFKPCKNCKKVANYAVCARCQTTEIV